MSAEGEYEAFNRHRRLFLLLLAVAIFGVIVLTVSYGDYRIDYLEIIKCLFFMDIGSTEHVVIWNIRMPRVVAGILVGSALGVSGAVMQSILRNLLASPYTLGISNSAAFGAAFALMASYWGIFSGTVLEEILSGVYGMSLFAFLFSLIAVGVIIVLSRLTLVTPEAMVLMGVALGAIFSAGLSSLQYFADDQTLASMVYWQFGDLAKASWNKLLLLFIVWTPVVLYFMYKIWDYNAMDADEDVASSMGINVKGERLLGMIAASVVTAVCISIAGIIGFIGLLGPHIVHRVVGNDNRYLIPGSMMLGALILLVADMIGRFMLPVIIPVGIITSFLGGPLFIYILIRGYRRNAEN